MVFNVLTIKWPHSSIGCLPLTNSSKPLIRGMCVFNFVEIGSLVSESYRLMDIQIIKQTTKPFLF